MGDLFHSRVLCETAQRVFRPAELTFSCEQRYAEIVQSFPEVNQTLAVDLSALTSLTRLDASLPDAFSDMYELVKPNREFDIVINLTNHRAAVRFAEILSGGTFIGYGGDGSDMLSSFDELSFTTSTPPHIAHVWQSLVLANSETMYPQHLCSRVGLSDRRSLALICDAGDTSRSLSSASITALINSAIDVGFERIVLLGAQPSEVAEQFSQCVHDLRGATSLQELRNQLEQAHAVAGPDTGALHFAAALGKKVLGIYLAGARPECTGPLSESALCISHYTQGEALEAKIDEAVRKHFYMSTSSVQRRVNQHDDSLCQLSIVIPEYAQTHYADALLNSLKECKLPSGTEIIVVSSGLDPVDTRTATERTNVISDVVSGKRSFARACNRGALLANGKWLLFLNDDCDVTERALTDLWDAREKNAIVAPRLRYWDGLMQSAGFTFDGMSVNELSNGHWSCLQGNESVQGVSAAAMLIARESYSQLGGFDETFVNGYEDVDLCLRARTNSICVKIADCEFTHFRGSSPERFDSDVANLQLLRSRWQDSVGPITVASPLRKMSAPLIAIVSDEEPQSAGAVLRWRTPLTSCGLQEGVNFDWISTRNADSFTKELLASARAVIAFRSITNKNVRSAILEWREQNAGILCYDCDDIMLKRFPADSIRHRNREVFEAGVRELVANSDVLIAPNNGIAQQYNFSSAIEIILRTLPFDKHFSTAPTPIAHETYRIGYCGSAVHQTDLALVTPTVSELLEENENMWFYWWGAHPGAISAHPRVRRGGSWVHNYETHVERVQRADIDLWISPLSDAAHNSVRSPIKAYEYIGGAKPCLFSDVEPFRSTLRANAPDLLVKNEGGAWRCAIEAWQNPVHKSLLSMQVTAMREKFQNDYLDLSGHRDLVEMLIRDTNAIRNVQATKEAVA